MKLIQNLLTLSLLVFLVAGFLTGPVTARDIDNGGTAFIYETGVSFTGNLATITELIYYGGSHTPEARVSVNNPSNFEFMEGQFSGHTGSWTASDGTNDLGTIWVQYPEFTFDIVLTNDQASSAQEYGFQDVVPYSPVILAPQVGTVTPAFATVDIIFRNEDGAETTFVSGKNYAGISIDSAKVVVPMSFYPNDLGPGLWTIYAKWSSPTGFKNYAPTSNVIKLDKGHSPSPTKTTVPTDTETVSPTEVPTTPPVTEPPTNVPTEIPTKAPTPATSPLSLLLAPLALCLAGACLRRP